MDYSLGSSAYFLGDPIRDGGDLTALRRAFEAQKGGKKAYILGTSSNQVGNELMVMRGADSGLLKLKLPEMAEEISRLLSGRG